ncbi:MAG: NAD(P)/FAD-dependent oxidoreductase [Mariprofundaceae bacterium]|nr:NAD(P)/FAD-dependent oxidoreductase [Mariprofundaceae bacterium]
MLNRDPSRGIPSPPIHDELRVSGAGPAGLTAAITCARAGATVIVHERKAAVGLRFHGDFQGQENWTSPTDVLEELAEAGIRTDFPHAAFHHLVAYDPEGRAFHFSSEQPLFYLVRRGSGPDTLDSALLKQAQELGVEVRFDDRVTTLPAGGICAEGPKAGDVIATGYQFETDLADGAYAALSDDLAPKGYAYLLIHAGHATLASCMFDDFHHEHVYLKNCVDFFQNKLGFSMDDQARRFGGLGNVSYPGTACKGNILYVGEAAGFQDALWGFGMRYAMVSGKLAAQAWLQGKPEAYDQMWQQTLGPGMRAGIVNRFIFSRLGNKGYSRFLTELAASQDVRGWLMRHHREQWYTHLLFPWANRFLPSKRKEFRCAHAGCACTWCRSSKGCEISHG